MLPDLTCSVNVALFIFFLSSDCSKYVVLHKVMKRKAGAREKKERGRERGATWAGSCGFPPSQDWEACWGIPSEWPVALALPPQSSLGDQEAVQIADIPCETIEPRLPFISWCGVKETPYLTEAWPTAQCILMQTSRPACKRIGCVWLLNSGKGHKSVYISPEIRAKYETLASAIWISIWT